MFDYQRKIAGVLLHISSLPSGTLGEDAFRFVDFLYDCGCQVWQTLPVNMTHQDKSPYQCLSAHAGNPAFICFKQVSQQSWLKQALPQHCDAPFQHLYQQFSQYANAQQQAEWQAFCQRHAHWLDDFALFLALREQHHGLAWCDWPAPIKLRQPEALAEARQRLALPIQQHQFSQFLFFSQWQALKQYAHVKGLQLFGDIPIFVSYDSADVWAQPQQFKLDQALQMTVVAGVPPDYFSADGQRWGNPHYDWAAMQQDDFAWWVQRLQTQALLFDILRIDHFRGLQAAWEIPMQDNTAVNGVWHEAPGAALLDSIFKQMPDIQLIAEDLGIITDQVLALKQQFALPGMKILQFAFDGSADNPYLPEKIQAPDVVYTGTHDNDTSLGWYQQLTEQQQALVQALLSQQITSLQSTSLQLSTQHSTATCLDHLAPPYPMPDTLIALALASPAFLAMIPMQDIMQLDSQHRMNTPGTIQGNWAWQFAWPQVSPERIAQIRLWLTQSARLH